MAAMRACASSSRGRDLTTSAGSDRQPPVDGRHLAAEVKDHVEVLLDEPGRPGHLPGGHRVPDRVIGQLMLLIPGCSVTVQLRRAAGLFLLQAGAQQVGEQVVVAPPAAHLIQRHHEQPRPLHLLQQRLAAGAAGDRIAQRAADSRSSTEVSSRNVRTCSLCCSSTSSAR